MGVSETVFAAMIGALATIVTATFQLVSSWRSHNKAAAGDRRTEVRRGGLRSLLMLALIVLASAVGGYAYSQYRFQELRDDARSLRSEMQQQLHLLETTTSKLEQMRLGMVSSEAASNGERRKSVDTAIALVQVPVCKAGGGLLQSSSCSETDAPTLSVCATVPANARVSEVELFARPTDAQTAWNENRVSAGQIHHNAKFVDGAAERTIDGSKEVCYAFASWNTDKALAARVMVKYVRSEI